MSMDKSMVLLKTVKGLDEIQNKVYGLAPKRRRVLIMVDGRATVAEMLDRLAGLGADLEAQLESLLAEGFLAPAGGAVPATGGALYGRASHGWMASFQRPKASTEIEGLFLAGGSAHPGPGVPMAALSGLLAAESLLAQRASTPRFRRVATAGGTSMA